MTVIVHRFECRMPPLGVTGFAAIYHLPSRLVSELIAEMVDAGLLSVVVPAGNDLEAKAYQPALDTNELSLGYVLDTLNNQGADNFVPDFDISFSGVLEKVDRCLNYAIERGSDTLLKNIPVELVENIKADVR